MFITFGSPQKLASLNDGIGVNGQERRRARIAVIDDEPFTRADSLRASGFDLIEIGDIKSIDMIVGYPVVICDIRGVGTAFQSRFEGAHVLAEIRATYPDKYLIAFTGMTYDATYNSKLAKADVSATKDMDAEAWTQILSTAVKEVSDPVRRWLRFRKHVLESNVDLYSVFKLEQAFIKSIERKDQSYLTNETASGPFSKETKELVMTFAATAVSQLIQGALAG
jgi:hypothetical protein